MNGPHPRIRRSAIGATNPLALPRHRVYAVPDPLTCTAAASAARPGPPGRPRG